MLLKLCPTIQQRLSWLILGFAIIVAIGFAVGLQERPLPETDYVEAGLKAYEKKDYDKATMYFFKGDQENNAQATFLLGALYMAGLGVDQSPARAKILYTKSADAGFPMAQTTLAILYADGDQSSESKQLAEKYALQAAKQGDVEAQMMLAKWYELGFFGEKNIPQMLYWYDKAALNGIYDAKLALALIYQKGMHGVPINIYKANRWYDSIEKQKQIQERFSGVKRPVKYTRPPLQDFSKPLEK